MQWIRPGTQYKPRIVDIRPASSFERFEILVPDAFFPVITRLNRNPDEFSFLFRQLAASPKTLFRVLQVGIGNTMVGETLHILDMLERLKKPYELVCMDRMPVVLGHALSDEYKLDGGQYSFDPNYSPERLHQSVANLACVRNVHSGQRYAPFGFGEFGQVMFQECSDITFDIPSEILDNVSYVIADVARHVLPPEMHGFDVIICFRTLYQLAHDVEQGEARIESGLRNLARYLNPGALLAVDSARLHIYGILTPELAKELGLEIIFDSKLHGQTPMQEWPRIYRMNSDY